MTIKPGDAMPDAQLMYMTDAGPAPISTGDLFGGKTVALFALPGAFTPTCSNQHLPGYVDKAEDLRAKGVDTIVCLAVNDAFVMGAWGQQQGANGKVMMVADGNAELTKKLGLEMDGSGFGMGTRSLRYSMIVRDGVVETLNVEQNPGKAVDRASKIFCPNWVNWYRKAPCRGAPAHRHVRCPHFRHGLSPRPIRLCGGRRPRPAPSTIRCF